MRIGELARSVGVNVETIRYYQRIGLIELPEKPYGGMRSYDDGGSVEDCRHLTAQRSVETLVLRRVTDQGAV
jgi:DNA-binding transcriptional MerR regulator